MGKGRPASLVGYGLVGADISYRDRLIPFALVTVAAPAQATYLATFDWQLGGPFSGGVRTGITPFPGSLGRRVNAYSSSSTLLNYLLIGRESTASRWSLST
jgi:hypothetical protein